jgi:hypothetical protein
MTAIKLIQTLRSPKPEEEHILRAIKTIVIY